MKRCLHLAELAGGSVAPNPMVGAVLVYGDRIIGEGYHKQYGQAHAEVNCINSVKKEHQELIPSSVLYVSLEPCSHFGKTPPCTELIIRNRIPKVVIACPDPYFRVAGKGIVQLEQAGVHVVTGVLNDEAVCLNKRFFHFQKTGSPYVVLKWAQTADGKIAAKNFRRTAISSAQTNRVVHKWRSEEMSILVGTNTALFDDPKLTSRLWPGNNPVRLVLDMNLRLPASLRLFDGTHPTIVFNRQLQENHLNLSYQRIRPDTSIVSQMLEVLAAKKIQSVLVEGGAQLLQAFIDENAWDEARVITNHKFSIGQGVPGPLLKNAHHVKTERILNDSIQYFRNQSSFH